MVELYCNVQSDNGSLTEGWSDESSAGMRLLIGGKITLSQWSARYLESMEGLKDPRAPLRLPDMMRQAGFVDVEHRVIQLPTCGWSTGSYSNTVGK